MKNVLFFAYEFPPVQTTGSIRPLKFVKYIREFGYNPIIITTDYDSGLRTFKTAKIDNGLLGEIENDITIIRIPSEDYDVFYSNKFKSFIHHYFSVSDHIKYHWGINIHKHIGSIIKEYQPILIYATAPPFGVATIAATISKKYHLPLVMDMRDHWSLWGTSAYISWFHYYFTHLEEKKVFSTASAIISVTEQVIDDFKRSHPTIEKSKFHVIPNGFENNGIDFNIPILVNNKNKNKIIIGYMGEFYYSPEAHDTIFKKWYKKKIHRIFQYIPRKEDYKYRSPYYFFKALKGLLDEQPTLKNIIEFHYIGGEKDWLNKMVDEFDLTANFVPHGKVNYEKSKELALNFDYCLSTSLKIEKGEDYALASKTFDYLTIGKPILGFVCDGSQNNFLKECGVAYVFNPDETEENIKKLIKLLTTKNELKYNVDFLKNYERRKNAHKLSLIFNSLSTNS